MIAQSLLNDNSVNHTAAEEIRHKLLCVLGAAESNYNLILSTANYSKDVVELQRLTIEKLTELIFKVSSLVNSSPVSPEESQQK